MPFEFPEDREFFLNFLARGDERLFEEKYSRYFDFRDPETKRKEFNSARKKIYEKFISERGLKCQLNIVSDCSESGEFAVDHFIPLKSNELNKKLRGMVREGSEKVPAQSFGSNHPDNLLLACKECNREKGYLFWKPAYRVLLIEDDEYWNDLGLRRLELSSNPRVEFVKWSVLPEDFITKARELGPDIIAFHSANPRDKSVDPIRLIRKDERLGSVPIFLSGYYGSRVSLAEWCEIGITDFVPTFKSEEIISHYMSYLLNPRRYLKERSLCSVAKAGVRT